jgi:hypothetical protein
MHCCSYKFLINRQSVAAKKSAIADSPRQAQRVDDAAADSVRRFAAHCIKGWTPMLTRVKTIAAAFVMAGFLAVTVAPAFAPAAQAAQAQTAKPTAKKKTGEKKAAAPAKKKTGEKKAAAKPAAKKAKKA